MKRSEFLEFLHRVTARAKAFGRHRLEQPALDSLLAQGMALPGDTKESNPILRAVIEVAFGTEDYFARRAAEELAWEYYEEREKGTRGHIHGFAPTSVGTSAGATSQPNEVQASAVQGDSGYGHGV